MVSKRRNPLEVSKASASASSSDEEDSEQSDIEEKEVKQQNNNVAEEEDEDESGGEEEEAGSGSESESENESDADSDKTPPSPNVSDFTVKPISSKPMKESDSPTKPESKPNKKKRVSETEPSNQESSKTKKNKPSLNNEDDDGVEESTKKGSGIARLWSFEDEIVILKGMIEYQSSKGTIMYSDVEAFHEFIKKSLHVEVSNNQLMDKIRRLKKKYLTLVEKGKDGGEEPAFSKPHEGKIFELSKKVWSFPNDAKKKKVKNVVNGNVKIKSEADRVGDSVLALPIQEAAVKQEGAVKQERVGVSNWGVKREKKEEVVSFESNYPFLNEVVESGNFFELTVPMFVKCGMKEMISSTESSKLEELEKKGKKLMMDEAELYLKKLELIEEQTKLILDAMRASASKS